jgi:hypothetical protein
MVFNSPQLKAAYELYSDQYFVMRPIQDWGSRTSNGVRCAHFLVVFLSKNDREQRWTIVDTVNSCAFNICSLNRRSIEHFVAEPFHRTVSRGSMRNIEFYPKPALKGIERSF